MICLKTSLEFLERHLKEEGVLGPTCCEELFETIRALWQERETQEKRIAEETERCLKIAAVIKIAVDKNMYDTPPSASDVLLWTIKTIRRDDPVESDENMDAFLGAHPLSKEQKEEVDQMVQRVRERLRDSSKGGKND